MLEKAGQVPCSMDHAQDLQRFNVWPVNDQIRANTPKPNWPICQITSHVALAGPVCKALERLIDFRDDSIRGWHVITRDVIPNLLKIQRCLGGERIRLHAPERRF